MAPALTAAWWTCDKVDTEDWLEVNGEVGPIPLPPWWLRFSFRYGLHEYLMRSYPRLHHNVTPVFPSSKTKQWPPALSAHTHTGRGYVPVWFIVRLLHRHTDPDKSPSSSHDWSADIHGMSPGLFWALHFKRGPAHDRHLTRSGCFATIPRLSENQPGHTLNLRQAVSLQRAVLHLMDAY